MTAAQQRTAATATVVVSAYNSATTVRRSLDSATRQTLRDIEILVVDDASTDDTASVIADCARLDPRIRLIRLSQNGGKAAAMNMMMAQARGRWIAVLDADDTFHVERLERLIAVAETAEVDMAADNLVFIDAGARQVVRTAFEPCQFPYLVDRKDFLRNSNSYAGFDFGILKPVIRRQFLLEHNLQYFEKTRLAEDFYHMMMFFLVGGRGIIVPDSFYYWTMPFGPVSRRWTTTGSGAWRYDYRQALVANAHFEGVVRRAGDRGMLRLLRRRARQYRVMVTYLAAQRAAAEQRWAACVGLIASHPDCYGLLLRRIVGRIWRGLAPPQTPMDIATRPANAANSYMSPGE